jgi:hypothetical protein
MRCCSDYIRRIEGKEEPDKPDQPSVIIGAGRLGKALAEWGDTGRDVVLGRGEAIPEEIVMAGERVRSFLPPVGRWRCGAWRGVGWIAGGHT